MGKGTAGRRQVHHPVDHRGARTAPPPLCGSIGQSPGRSQPSLCGTLRPSEPSTPTCAAGRPLCAALLGRRQRRMGLPGFWEPCARARTAGVPTRLSPAPCCGRSAGRRRWRGCWGWTLENFAWAWRVRTWFYKACAQARPLGRGQCVAILACSCGPAGLAVCAAAMWDLCSQVGWGAVDAASPLDTW